MSNDLENLTLFFGELIVGIGFSVAFPVLLHPTGLDIINTTRALLALAPVFCNYRTADLHRTRSAAFRVRGMGIVRMIAIVGNTCPDGRFSWIQVWSLVWIDYPNGDRERGFTVAGFSCRLDLCILLEVWIRWAGFAKGVERCIELHH
jgi:hypothetical protein